MAMPLSIGEEQILALFSGCDEKPGSEEQYFGCFSSGKRYLIFVHDYATGRSALRLSSDTTQQHDITSGYFNLMLDTNEAAWAQACWQAARELTGILWRK